MMNAFEDVRDSEKEEDNFVTTLEPLKSPRDVWMEYTNRWSTESMYAKLLLREGKYMANALSTLV